MPGSERPPTAAFHSRARLTLSIAAVASLASAVAWRRWRRRRGPLGVPGQGPLLTPTALVVVDSHAVAVLPAEHVQARAKELTYRDVVVSRGGHEASWVE